MIVALPALFPYFFLLRRVVCSDSCLVLSCYCVLSPISIVNTSLGEEGANLIVFDTFVRFALVWFCLFPLPPGVWKELRLVIVALPGLFSYHVSFFSYCRIFDRINQGR